MNQDSIILLSKSFFDLTDITKRKGDYSKSFDLPRTQKNDYFFGLWGEPSSIGPLWDHNEAPNCWVIEDSNVIIEGSLRLEQVNRKNDLYTISVSGRIFTIKQLLSDDLMSDLDMSSWSFTPGQVDQTWNASLFSGDMIFPLHDPGQGIGLYKEDQGAFVYGDPDSSTLSPIIADRNIPCFRLNELLRKIFNERDLLVSGTWFSETYVEDIYVQADNPLKEFTTKLDLFSVDLSPAFSISTTPTLIPLKINPSSSSEDWNDAASSFTAPNSGTYYFNYSFAVTAGTPAGQLIYFDAYINGVFYANYNTFNWNGSPMTGTNAAVPLTAGDVLTWRISSDPFTTAGQISGTSCMTLVSVALTGPTVDPSIYWENHKQIDFLREIAGIFNLIVWMPDTQEVKIDTWDGFNTTYGEKKDWSDKVDFTREPVLKPINTELQNPIFLSFKEAEDVINKDYIDVVGRPFGSYLEDTRLPFTREQGEAFKKFAPMPVNKYIPSKKGGQVHDDWYFLRMFSSEEDVTFQQSGLILCYYNGARALADSIYYKRYEADLIQTATSYPFFAPYRLFSITSYLIVAGTPDLNYAWFEPPDSGMVNAPTTNNLYNKYFAEMLRERYDENTKLIELDFILDSVDIANFSFADTILINFNGTPAGLRILEIKDFSPNFKKSTTVKAMITFVK
jgi:hypothetical protein